MKNLKQTLFSLVVILAAGVIAACIDDSNAQSSAGVTRAEYDALVATVATLQAKITALEANQPGDKVFAAGSGSSPAKAATSDGKPLGTMVGHLPADVPLSQSQFFSLKSSAGYLYAVSNERSGSGLVGLATYAGDGATGSRYVYFGTPDCSSFPIVPGSDVSDYGASQGLVFMIGSGEFNQTIDDPAQYLYIPAGSERAENSSYASRMSRVGFCEAETGTLPTSYVALPNDPTVTGVDSAPVAAPVTLADPA